MFMLEIDNVKLVKSLCMMGVSRIHWKFLPYCGALCEVVLSVVLHCTIVSVSFIVSQSGSQTASSIAMVTWTTRGVQMYAVE
jgi:hypothetical protein